MYAARRSVAARPGLDPSRRAGAPLADFQPVMADVPPRVEVEWVDAQGMPAWEDVDTITAQVAATWDLPHYTSGYLLKETDDYLAVASSWRPATDILGAQACDVIVIPLTNVRRRRTLRS